MMIYGTYTNCYVNHVTTEDLFLCIFILNKGFWVLSPCLYFKLSEAVFTDGTWVDLALIMAEWHHLADENFGSIFVTWKNTPICVSTKCLYIIILQGVNDDDDDVDDDDDDDVDDKLWLPVLQTMPRRLICMVADDARR